MFQDFATNNYTMASGVGWGGDWVEGRSGREIGDICNNVKNKK